MVLAVLAAVVVACPTSPDAQVARLDIGSDASVTGVLQAAGLLFFAFAGYARTATLGEEAKHPARTIPRAIPLALGIRLIVYAAVAVSVLAVLGPDGSARESASLAGAVRQAGVPGLVPVVRVGAAVAALGSLFALIPGVSRTTLALSRDRHLPHALSAVHPRVQGALSSGVAGGRRGGDPGRHHGRPRRHRILLLRRACLLRRGERPRWTLTQEENWPPRTIPAVGLAGCLVLAFTLPATSVAWGAAVLALGTAVYGVRRRLTAGQAS